jgi:hypothetical protein
VVLKFSRAGEVSHLELKLKRNAAYEISAQLGVLTELKVVSAHLGTYGLIKG